MSFEKKWLKNPAIAQWMSEILDIIKKKYPAADIEEIAKKAQEGLILNPFLLEKEKEEWKRALAGLIHLAYARLFDEALEEVLDKYKVSHSLVFRNIARKLLTELIGAEIKSINVLSKIAVMRDFIKECVMRIVKLISKFKDLRMDEERKIILDGLLSLIESLEFRIKVFLVNLFVSELIKNNLFDEAKIFSRIIEFHQNEISTLPPESDVLYTFIDTLVLYAELILKEGKFKKVGNICNKILTLCEQSTDCNLQIARAYTLTILAMSEYKLGDFNAGINHINEAINIFKKLSKREIRFDYWRYIQALFVRALILYEMGELEKALESIEEGEQIMTEKIIQERLEEVTDFFGIKAKILAKLGKEEMVSDVLNELETILINYGTKRQQLKLLLVQVDASLLLNKKDLAKEILSEGMKACQVLLDTGMENVIHALCTFIIKKSEILFYYENKLHDALEQLKLAEVYCSGDLRKGKEYFRTLLINVLKLKSEVYRKLGKEDLSEECRLEIMNLIDC